MFSCPQTNVDGDSCPQASGQSQAFAGVEEGAAVGLAAAGAGEALLVSVVGAGVEDPSLLLEAVGAVLAVFLLRLSVA